MPIYMFAFKACRTVFLIKMSSSVLQYYKLNLIQTFLLDPQHNFIREEFDDNISSPY